jgi:hypothetical protein
MSPIDGHNRTASWRAHPLSLVGRLWSRASRLRQPSGTPEAWEERRLQWVRDNAPGHSFADIGGLFKYMGGIAILAEEVGATSVTLFDVGDPDLIDAAHPEWGCLGDKLEQHQSKVRYLQGNLEDPESVRRIGVHDVVFYSGVLYHTPHPVKQLMHLREITGERLFLSSLTIPEIPGFEQACVFYPHLSDQARRPYAAGYSWSADLYGIGTPVDERPMYGYGNCWWGISGSALEAMLTTARFEIVQKWRLPLSPWMTELEARPLPGDPMLPPESYFRERGDARERGEQRWSFDTWYEDQRR